MKKNIANIITLMNLASGAVGIILTLKGDFTGALVAMLVASIFDFCDGFVARLLKIVSPIGKELDSLCDVVSFGVLPTIMLCSYLAKVGAVSNLMVYLPILIAMCSAYRLGKFNVDDRQSYVFLGLATPSAGLLIASIVAYAAYAPQSWIAAALALPYILALLVALVCVLLVCEIPMFSMKFGSKDEYRLPRAIFLGLSALGIVVLWHEEVNWTIAPCLIFTIYIICNFLAPILPKK